MRHPSEGELRAALSEGGGTRHVREHVSGCRRCSEAAEHVQRSLEITQRQLSLLGDDERSDAREALGRFRVRMERNTGVTEFGKSRFRPAYTVGIVVALLVAALFFTPVRSAASELLNVFRVEKFAAITIDPSQPPFNVDTQEMIDRAERGDKHLHDGERPDPNVFGTYSGPLRPERPVQVSSLQAAEDKVGSELADAGASVGGYARTGVWVTSARKASYTFDTEKIQAKLDERGLKGVKAPKQIDGKTFTASFPAGVFVRYGSERNSVVFAQGDSPTLAIPKGVNMDGLRQDFLMLPGLPANLKQQIQEIEDWEHTLIIPLPPGGSSEEVKIDGAEGLLIHDRTGEHNGVLWQRDGKLYALGGKISSEAVIKAARSVKYP